MKTQVNTTKVETGDLKEAAFRYDLTLAPRWREWFDALVDAEMPLPEKGKLLDLSCGTGNYTVDLALRAGHQTQVIGVAPNPEMLAIARGKAAVKKAERVTFVEGSLSASGLGTDGFIWAVGDATLEPVEKVAPALSELHRVGVPGATLGLTLTTRGSFDEVFSVYWETLQQLDWLEFAPALETLIQASLTVSEAEALARQAGWKKVRSVTEQMLLEFADGTAFLTDALLTDQFLPAWLALLPSNAQRNTFRTRLCQVVDEAREGMSFVVSVKGLLVLGEA